MTDVTRILDHIHQGDPRAAEQLLPLVYAELRKLATEKMAQERPGQTLQATALVHEAYLRLVGKGEAQHWDSRGHFFAAAAEAMRRILVENARIAKVLGAGATDTGRPYFVMELVHGISLTKYCDDNKLTPRQRLELFVPICQAIQHAHQKGIIHRDVKPSNVLVTMYDDKPVPKVIDFGVAKGGRATADGEDAVHPVRHPGRHLRVHEPRASGDERVRCGHAQRRVLPGSALV